MGNRNDFELETWIVQVGGEVIERKTAHGAAAISSLEKLIYCLWVADYGMRNGGSLETAADVYTPFQNEGASLAFELELPRTLAAFSLPTAELESRYFELLGEVVGEIDSKRCTDGGGDMHRI